MHEQGFFIWIFLDNCDTCGLFGGFSLLNISYCCKILLKWLAMALLSVVITLFIYKLICRDFFVFLLLLMISLIASHTFFQFFFIFFKKVFKISFFV